MVALFGRSVHDISQIFNVSLTYVHTHFTVLLQSLDQPWIQNNLSEFTAAIHEKGAPLQNCWAFIDGTVRPMCRPMLNQKVVYNGHKRVHALKFQGLTTPNGLIANLAGPYEGKKHDASLLAESEILEDLSNLRGTRGEEVCIYGDAAYPMHPSLIAPFPTRNLTPEQAAFNLGMSKVCQAVEWSFGKVIQQFAFLDLKKKLKLNLQPLGKYYIVGTILTNCHTCTYDSQTSNYGS